VADIFQTIPGLRDAVQRESRVRDNAFLIGLVPERVCGFEIRPLTLTTYLLLEKIRSPFLITRPLRVGEKLLKPSEIVPSPDATFNALWILSANHRPTTGSLFNRIAARASRWVLRRRVARSQHAALVDGLRAFMEESMMDMPQGASSAPRIASSSYFAQVVDLLASEYGWTADYVMRLPMVQLWQLRNRIRKRLNPKATDFNLFSDRAKVEYLDKVNAEKGAAK
jgi:hypothetical protein